MSTASSPAWLPGTVIVVGSDRIASVELVVAEDGSIPASQLATLGVGPGTHLRVVPEPAVGGLEGSLSDFPGLSWEDFERASAVARSDLKRS